ncbi:MAG: MBL fold metallo-hydrolase, partial [Deltaproteobacteria bacterium]|nr:MBL fold metallo-hydrolase [Deltaproteobacteria bacterium]
MKRQPTPGAATALALVLPVLAALTPLVVGCHRQAPPAAGDAASAAADASGNVAASRFTAEANAAVAGALPIADAADFEEARRGLVATKPDLAIRTAGGRALWRPRDYAFVDGEAPASVNPSLWRQAKLNGIHGLFQVADGIYQVRGYDLSNLSLIRGRSGWIVVDPLTAKETAAAALALARKHLGNEPIVAVIFTHSHIDHFGGIGAVLEDPTTDPARLRVVAPKGFIEEATSENVLAGVAMGRRASFMYGSGLARSERGHVDTGLGKGPATGSIDILEPTDLIDTTPQELELDGVRFQFQYAPASEAPAEMAFFLPDLKAYCGAEIVSHVLHNLYTLRGAKVRDALKWSGYIDEAIELFSTNLDVVFASHHWPTFGNERVVAYLKQQRDAYKYLHDQTLRLANDGLGPQEIAEELTMPSTLASVFANRDYYGTVRHNAKAVYQAYFGWFDGNPANLNPLPPEQSGMLYVEAMGGAEQVLRRAQEAYDRGEYRWTATLVDHLVFAAPDNEAAHELLARCYDQLGYQAESGPWRDVYLTGAYELRHGTQGAAMDPAAISQLLRHMPAERFFDAMAAHLIGPKADGKTLTLNFVFTDLGQTHVLTIENAVLHHHKRTVADPSATATVTLTRDFLVRLSTGQAGLREMIFSNDLAVEGSRLDVLSFFSLLDRPDG